MVSSLIRTNNIKNRVVNLDLSEEVDLRTYIKNRNEFIYYNEVDSIHPGRSYKDTEGKVTVGVGFNMSQGGAKRLWDEAFSILPKSNRPDFDKVYNKKYELTKEEVKILYLHTLKIKEYEFLSGPYGNLVEYLTPNERLAIEDAFYNSRKLVERSGKKNTNFLDNIINYTETGDDIYLKYALYEIRYKSNKARELGIQNRREIEAIMFNTKNFDLDDLPIPLYEKNKIDQRIKEDKKFLNQLRPTKEQAFDIVGEWIAENLIKFIGQITGLFEFEPEDPLEEEEKDSYQLAISGDFFHSQNEIVNGSIKDLESVQVHSQTLVEVETNADLIKIDTTQRLAADEKQWFKISDQKLDEARQKKFGIKRYRWRTAGDEKVRLSHALNEGQIFEWNKLPETGHPGHEFGCRCSAEPVS